LKRGCSIRHFNDQKFRTHEKIRREKQKPKSMNLKSWIKMIYLLLGKEPFIDGGERGSSAVLESQKAFFHESESRHGDIYR
jgi:hypothetical protein